jgi:nickel/cobalt transporter (NicO) family protein
MSANRYRFAFVGLVSVGFLALGASPAAAHPLGNFSVNHLNRLSFNSVGVVDDVIIDTAEIPTAQAESQIDRDGDGTATPSELQSFALERCSAFNAATTLRIDGDPVGFAVTSTSFSYNPGQAGLQISRLECRLEAIADLTSTHAVQFSDGYLPDRIGWKEINAVASAIEIVNSPVPLTSVTNGLSVYPVDLLNSPMDVRDATFNLQPASSANAPASTAQPTRKFAATHSGFWSGAVDRIQRTFDDLIGRRELTLSVGFLAIGLALILGASHALLPGHGKTVMAAYIAGRQGSVRDAVIVGATVTGTHTGGVLLLGLALTLSTSLAGESVLGWLGVTSGVMIAGLGLGLLWNALKHRGGLFGHGHSHAYGFDDGHHHEHDHHEHDHHEHDHHEHDHHDHDHGHGHHGHDHHGHDHHSHDEPKHVSRRGLIGMGIAGGLVPSPSALVILLSAIALGRTWFGVLLVVGYGVGMAGTLTAAGVLMVRVRDRYRGRGNSGRLATATRRWRVAAPYFTAGLVTIVGLGLAVRSIGTV